MVKTQVKYVRLHEGVFIPSMGQFGDCLPSSSKSFPNLKLSVDDAGLLIEVGEGKTYASILVPHANCICMQLGDAVNVPIPPAALKVV